MTPSGGDHRSSKSKVGAWFGKLSGPKKVATVIVAVATGVAAIGSAVSMMFTGAAWLFPSIKPPPPSVESEANLSNLEVVPNVTLGEYFQWPGMPAKDVASRLSEEQLQRLGSIIYFDVELKGFAGERLALKWSVFDADTTRPIRGLTNQGAWPSNFVRPQHDVSRRQLETWVPFPQNGRGAFLVRLDVYATLDGGEALLDSEEVEVSTLDNGTAADS
jgi:hypothetical protein